MAAGNEVIGIDADIVRTALNKAGYPVCFLQLPWERQLFMARHGELDIVMDASKSPERDAFAGWSRSYRSERVALMSLEDPRLKVTSLSQLLAREGNIGLIRGSVYNGEFETLRKHPAFAARLEFTPQNEQNLQKLRVKRIQYLIDDPVTIQYLAGQVIGPKVVLAYEISSDPVYFLISRKTLIRHPEFLARFDAALQDMEKHGEMARILAKYGVVQ
jgi:ABC-type amino acid transport substrate-binding protein